VLADIKAAPQKSVFLFHACAHNPTGVDPTPDQWAVISRAIKEKEHFVILDSAYQVRALGDRSHSHRCLSCWLAGWLLWRVALSRAARMAVRLTLIACLCALLC